MKFQTEITVARTLPFVTKLFENQDNNRFWQSTFVSMQPDNFDASKSVNYYRINGRLIEVLIRVVENCLPEYYTMHISMPGLEQKVRHRFMTDKTGKTKWVVVSEFTADSFVLKAIMFLCPNIFRSRTAIYMQDFKIFAENIAV